MTLTQQIQNLILEWIGEDKEVVGTGIYTHMISIEYVGYNQALQDIREKVPALAEQLLAKLNQE